jgi:hypothetical protein
MLLIKLKTSLDHRLMCEESKEMAFSIGSLILQRRRNIGGRVFYGMLFDVLLLFSPFDQLCFLPERWECCHRFLSNLCTTLERSYMLFV